MPADAMLSAYQCGYRVRASEFRRNKFQVQMTNGRWYIISTDRLSSYRWSEGEKQIMLRYLLAYKKEKPPAETGGSL